MKVKIIKCSDNDWWYANHIGDIVEVTDTVNIYDDYEVIHIEKQYPECRFLNLDIANCDCEVVENTEEVSDTKVTIKGVEAVEDYKTLSNTKWMIHSISTDLLVHNPANDTLMFTLDEAQKYIRDSAMNPICYDLIEVTGNIMKTNIDFRSV